jgi:hypothetical protein
MDIANEISNHQLHPLPPLNTAELASVAAVPTAVATDGAVAEFDTSDLAAARVSSGGGATRPTKNSAAETTQTRPSHLHVKELNPDLTPPLLSFFCGWWWFAFLLW